VTLHIHAYTTTLPRVRDEEVSGAHSEGGALTVPAAHEPSQVESSRHLAGCAMLFRCQVH